MGRVLMMSSRCRLLRCEETHGHRSRGVWMTPLRRVGLRRLRRQAAAGGHIISGRPREDLQLL